MSLQQRVRGHGNPSRTAVLEVGSLGPVARHGDLDAPDALPLTPLLLRLDDAPNGRIIRIDYWALPELDLVWRTKQTLRGFEVIVALVPNGINGSRHPFLAEAAIPLPTFLRPGVTVIVQNRDGTDLFIDVF